MTDIMRPAAREPALDIARWVASPVDDGVLDVADWRTLDRMLVAEDSIPETVPRTFEVMEAATPDVVGVNVGELEAVKPVADAESEVKSDAAAFVSDVKSERNSLVRDATRELATWGAGDAGGEVVISLGALHLCGNNRLASSGSSENDSETYWAHFEYGRKYCAWALLDSYTAATSTALRREKPSWRSSDAMAARVLTSAVS